MHRPLVSCIVLTLTLAAVPAALGQTRTVADLIADLKKADADKLKAIAVLDALGPKAGEAAPALIELLAQSNEDVRLASAIALGKMGPAAVEPLTKILATKYATPQNLDQLNAFVKRLGSDNFKERELARKELETIGYRAVPALEEMIAKKTDVETIRRAEDLIKTIRASAGTRYYLVWSLAFNGPAAKSATPTVVKALQDPSADVRRKAIYTLGIIDADPALVVGPLVQAFTDSDNDVRETAVATLPKLRKEAVPVLRKALKNENTLVQFLAIRTLGQCGPEAAPAIPDLAAFLRAYKFAGPAAEALAGIGAPAIKELAAIANEDNQLARPFAVNGLFKIGPPAVVPVFIDLLGSPHKDVRGHVAALLGNMQVQDKSVVIALGFATKDKEFQVRTAALQSLRNMGTGAKFAEPYVVALLTDIDPNIRLSAFYTLQNLGVDPRPGLTKALGHADLKTRITTASLMSQLNFEVELAAPVLSEGLKQKDEALKMQAAQALALRGLRSDEVLPIFIAGLKNDTPSVRRQAAEMIGRYGVKASKAGPELIAALDDKDDAVCQAALQTLRNIGADPKQLFPAMVKVLRRPDMKLHQMAAQIIFQVGPDAIPEVIAMLNREDAPGVRLACLQTLAMVGPPAKDAVGALIKTLEDGAPRVRMTAARALGNIGPDAKAAEAALTKATKDSDANVRQIAASALVQIKADPNRKDFEVNGVLTPGDPFDKVRGGCFHVVHTYAMKKGQRYQIDLNSQWDNFLRLENPQGVMVAQDDDSGGFPNARIIYAAPEDGWYRIIVTSFANNASGPYTLRIR